MNFKRLFYTAGILMLGGTILFVSVVKAGWKMTTEQENEGKIRNTTIEVTVATEGGQIKKTFYKLPEVSLLPTSLWYKIKALRDALWMGLGDNSIEKTKTVLLLADKKIVEAEELFERKNVNEAVEASREALNKLKYAESLVNQKQDKDEETKQLEEQIDKAGIVYQQVVGNMAGGFDLEATRYEETMAEIKEFNQKSEDSKNKE
ncbi:MAG: DUF5667 domain-containing protein [Candidatus Shapirobacteria bacterium]